MSGRLKATLKRTSLYRAYRAFRDHETKRKLERGLREWCDEDQKRLEFYSQFTKSGDTVFDVGANFGNRAKVFLKLGARVVAIEPQKQCADTLEKVLGRNPNFHLVRKALGSSAGEAKMRLTRAHTISSLSPDWISAVKESGRFDEYEWDRRETVAMDTLDNLISAYGCPAFIKIDVEGFEFEVLSGLTQPVPALSLEFVPEFLESTFKCINHVSRMAQVRCQICLGETMEFILPEWVSPGRAVEALEQTRRLAFGDLYIRSEDLTK